MDEHRDGGGTFPASTAMMRTSVIERESARNSIDLAMRATSLGSYWSGRRCQGVRRERRRERGGVRHEEEQVVKY